MSDTYIWNISKYLFIKYVCDTNTRQDTNQNKKHVVFKSVNWSYLYKRVPVRNGFPWVSKHLIPVFSAQTLSIITYSTHTYNLIVTYTVKKAKYS